jgi:hypothetical protein
MGYRCPICHKDFGKDKSALDCHGTECCSGSSKDLMDLITIKIPSIDDAIEPAPKAKE